MSLLPLASLPADQLAPPASERDHWLRVFLLCFGRVSFVEPEDAGRTFHLLALDEGRLWEEKVARSLSALVFGQVFPAIVQALDRGDRQRPEPRPAVYLAELKESALTLLYRLLFVLYAEDRELLPVRDPRYDDYGFRAVRDEIARRIDRGDTFSTGIATYQARLRGLFHAIAHGEPALGLPPYNGGLFDPARAPLLERAELPDAALAPVIDLLSRLGPAGARRWINYRDLSVQQLGSIYEGLLEYEVATDGEGVRIADDDSGRHASGSFYTPEPLVKLILERTIGPLVTDRRAAFAARAEALIGSRTPLPEWLAELHDLDPATRLLDLKVCDPAMGSGHFLVSLVDYLADEVLQAVAEAPLMVSFADAASPYVSPLLGRIAAIRRRILDHAATHGWNVVEAQLDDRRLIRRMILKRVIHGLDKNPMAVELAKVALWLHTFTVGAPLSFLDHHLRCGDSLLGLWVGDANRWLERRGSLIINRHIVPAQQAAGSMLHIEAITDADVAEVADSAATFAGLRAVTEPLAAFLSFLQAERLLGVLDAAPRARPRASKNPARDAAQLAAFARASAFNHILDGSFGDPVAVARGEVPIARPAPAEQLGLLSAPEPEQAALFAGSAMDAAHRSLAQTLLDEAHALARQHRFTHWQLAFPNIWRDWSSAEPQGGFDAVIGNPPYVRQEQLRAIKPALARGYRTYDGAADLYVYFYELGLRLLRPGGRLSFVVTNKWLRAGYAEELRGFFGESAWLEAIIDFGHAKGFFPAADVFPCVVVVRRPDEGDPPETATACQIPRDLVRPDRLSEQVADLSFALPRANFMKTAWVVEPPEVGALLQKIRGTGQSLRHVASCSPLYGIKTGLNAAFQVDTAVRDELVAADPRCDEIIRPFLRGQDIERWHIPWCGLWMIVLRSSSDHDWPWANAGEQAESIFAAKYPSLYARLKPLETALRTRQDRGRYWWELRSCAYYDLFDAPKIVHQEIQFGSTYAIDRSGLLGNNKIFILPNEDPFLLSVLNSPLMWWHNWRYLPHMKDEALTPATFLMEELPVATPNDQQRSESAIASSKLAQHHAAASAAGSILADWYRAEHRVERPNRVLAHPFALDVDGLVAALHDARGSRRPLTPTAVKGIREAWRETVAPIRERLREAARLECQLSNLVNAAYGLTPEEVSLMWATAPPRMPIPAPPGLSATD